MPPSVYLFHGEDEFTISQEIEKLERKLGDAAIASLNISRLDGRTLSFDELKNAVYVMPFMVPRRLVVVYHPLAKIENNPELKEKFLALLDQLPESTALVLVEYRSLEGDKKKPADKRKPHWLWEWAKQAGDRVHIHAFPHPDMHRWIRQQAKLAGGEFTPQAAAALVSLVNDDTRLATQEIAKLLAYVNYQRPVEKVDVEQLVAASGQSDIFELVDAVGMRNSQRAMRLLHHLLDEMDPLQIYSMILRQFRLLIQARELQDNGGTLDEVTRTLKLHVFVGKKVFNQAQRFSLAELEAIYRDLFEMDERIKTGRVEPDLALEAFIAGFAMQSDKPLLI